MDFNNLKKSVANLSLYDIKAGVRQLQNGSFNCYLMLLNHRLIYLIAVMNYTEMESKVREATNNEPSVFSFLP
jgi:epsin